MPTANLKLPSPDYKMPVTIVSPSHGAFVIAPQKQDGSEVLIGKQKRMAELSREGWEEFYADKDAAIAFLRQDAEIFGDVAVTATSAIPHEKTNIWPFYVIPKLDSWSSNKRRVLLVGDSAHAVPPSSGQGINQAVEDAVMLSILLGKGRSGKKDLGWWQGFRQDRIQQILLLNARVDRQRLPRVMGFEEQDDDEQGFDLDWLYGIDVVAEVGKYVSRL